MSRLQAAILRRRRRRNASGLNKPPAPTSLAITGASGGTVADLTPTLTFTAGAGATSHKVQWSTDPTFATVTGETTVAMPTAEYTHTVELDNFTGYSWRVAALKGTLQGPWSSVLTVQTWVVVFLDKFDTDDAAPLTDPLPTSPAGYSWDVHDTGAVAAVASGVLGWASSTANFDPTLAGANNLEAALPFPGGAVAFRFRSGGGRIQIGMANSSNAGGGSAIRLSPYLDANAGSLGVSGRVIAGTAYAVDNTWYWVALVQRATGLSFYLYGGAYTDWLLLFTVNDQSTLVAAATFVPFLQSIGTLADIDFDTVVAGVLNAPFATDTGLATAYQASSTADDVIAMTANALVEWQLTAATGVTQELSIRRTDDNNRLVVRCDQAGSTLKLIKIEAGGEAELQSVSQTWTNGTVYRVTAWCNGNTINAQAASGAEWATVSNPAISQSNAFNNSATGVKVSHNGGILASWPLVSAAASAQLNALIAGAA